VSFFALQWAFVLFSADPLGINIYNEDLLMTSQINPNNIDGNYPVPGVPNNTQGFRTNFTETKTNFQYAASEITNLQNSVLLKAALPGTTLDNNMNDNLLYAVKMQDVSYTYLPVTATAGNIAIDYAAAPYQQITTTGSVSLSFANWPAAASAGSVRVGFNITNTAHTVTLPITVTQGLIGLQGYDPLTRTITFGQIGNYAFEFVTVDAGATIWIFDQSRPADVFGDRVRITSEAASNSTATGALVVSGGVGIAGNLHVGGNIVGNITITGISLTGNVTSGNIITSGLVTASGNITGANLRTSGIVSATGNITGGNVSTNQLSLSGNVISALNVTGNITGGNVRSVGIVSAAGNVTGGNLITAGALVTLGSTVNSNITTTGNITLTGAGGVSSNNSGTIGYGAGSGGTVTQNTSKSTGVTLNKASGEITTSNATLNGDASVTFTLTNSVIANTDVMIVNHVSGGTLGRYTFTPSCNNGSATITIHNVNSGGGGAEGAALVLRFAVIKGATT
jgi:hypothetical protein